MHRVQILGVTAALISFAAVSSAQQLLPPADILISNGGDVTAQIAPWTGGPGYVNELYYVPAGVTQTSDYTYIGLNTDFEVPTPAVDLGTLNAGDEVKLAIHTGVNENVLNWFYTGPESRNSDGAIHAAMDTIDANTVRVRFEDLAANSSDWNYGDASVLVTGVHTAPVPEPATFMAIGLGVAALIRRKRNR